MTTNERSLEVRPERGLETGDSIRTMEEMFALAIRRRELLKDYIEKRLTTKHFYKVPGSDKPSLNKEVKHGSR